MSSCPFGAMNGLMRHKPSDNGSFDHLQAVAGPIPFEPEAFLPQAARPQLNARRSCIGATGILWFRRLHTLV